MATKKLCCLHLPLGCKRHLIKNTSVCCAISIELKLFERASNISYEKRKIQKVYINKLTVAE